MDTNKSQSPRLTGMVAVRVPPEFGDQVRAAARVEGVRPGALMRSAISERMEVILGISVMPDAEREEFVAWGGKGLLQNMDRAAVDKDFCERFEQKIEAARFEHMDRILSACRNLAEYIETQMGREFGALDEPEAVGKACHLLEEAHREMNAALTITQGMRRFACRQETE